MDESQIESATRGINIINVILGAWLVVSPFLLGYDGGSSRWNQIIFGAIAGLFAVWRLVDTSARWASWVVVLASAWLIIGPFALGYDTASAYWNEVIVAVVLLALSFTDATAGATTSHTHHHVGA